jgi:hypothetical protein
MKNKSRVKKPASLKAALREASTINWARPSDKSGRSARLSRILKAVEDFQLSPMAPGRRQVV